MRRIRRDVVAADVFPLALWERVRVREGSERDVIPYGCPFGMVTKKGRFGTDPYDIFSQPWDVGIADVFPLCPGERVRVRENSERDIVHTDVFPPPLGRGSGREENSRGMPSHTDALSGMVTKKGRFQEPIPLRKLSFSRDHNDVGRRCFPLALWERVRVRE